MERKYIFISLLILCFSILKLLHLELKIDTTTYMAKSCENIDAETNLACGRKINLSNATVADIQLIPGVSDSLAIALLDTREKIRSQTLKLEEHERYRALRIVRGIGLKKAQKIEGYLELL